MANRKVEGVLMAKKPEPQRAVGRMEQDARQKGRQARIDGKSRDTCPFTDYPGKGFQRAWLDGWDSVVPPPVQPAPLVSVQHPRIMTSGTFWPKDRPTPQVYHKRPELPCAKCLLVLLPDGKQAVVVSFTSGSLVTLVCRSCSHSFRLPTSA